MIFIIDNNRFHRFVVAALEISSALKVHYVRFWLFLSQKITSYVCSYLGKKLYVYIAVSLKNDAIASNSTLKCAFRADSVSELQYQFQHTAQCSISRGTLKSTHQITVQSSSHVFNLANPHEHRIWVGGNWRNSSLFGLQYPFQPLAVNLM